jgi:hypothetical protein
MPSAAANIFEAEFADHAALSSESACTGEGWKMRGGVKEVAVEARRGESTAGSRKVRGDVRNGRWGGIHAEGINERGRRDTN